MSNEEKAAGKGQQFYYAGIAGVVVVILIAVWLLFKSDEPAAPVIPVQEPAPAVSEDIPAPLPAPVVPDVQEPEFVDEPQVEPEPVSEPEPVKPLPALDESDTEVKQQLLSLNWRAGLASLFITDDMLRNFVVQVDNIAQGRLVSGYAVLQPLEQTFGVTSRDDLYIAEDKNYKRYDPYIQLLDSVQPAQTLKLYQRYEPLLQQAYAELGYPDSSFRLRLLEAIDVLLDTPDIRYPVVLERPSVMYTYADPQTEALPAAQKQMLRLGADNQKKFKALLKKYQQALQAL